jgi:hypothetical protein
MKGKEKSAKNVNANGQSDTNKKTKKIDDYFSKLSSNKKENGNSNGKKVNGLGEAEIGNNKIFYLKEIRSISSKSSDSGKSDKSSKSNRSDKSNKINSPSSTSKDNMKKEGVKNRDSCSICKNGGDLLLCDRCPKSFHIGCLKLKPSDIPEGEWYCPTCM